MCSNTDDNGEDTIEVTTEDPILPQHKESKVESSQIPHDSTRSKSIRHLSESSNETPNLRSKPTSRVTKRGKSHVSEENDYDDDIEDTHDSETSLKTLEYPRNVILFVFITKLCASGSVLLTLLSM